MDSALCLVQLVGLQLPRPIIVSLGVSHYSGSTRCCGHFDYFRADFNEAYTEVTQ